jgi:integrase
MATVRPILRTPKTNADGHAPIWLRFSDTRTTRYASLGVYVHPRFWNENRAEVRKGHPHADRINQLIQARLAEAEDERLRLLIEREPVTAERLKAAVSPAEAEAAPCYLAFARSFLEKALQKGNVGRHRREGTVLNKLEAFACPDAAQGGGHLPFDRITTDFLREYEAHLLSVKKNKASTVRVNLKAIRAHYLRAIKEGLVPRESDPFFAFTPVRAEKSERPKLTAAQLRTLETLDLGDGPGAIGGPNGSLEARVRDAFLFSLYAAGVRFADVARLRVGDVKAEGDGDEAPLRLTYRMGKTKKRVAVRLIPQAAAIAKAYQVDAEGREKEADAFLFPMLDGYDLSTPEAAWDAVGKQNALHNKYLRQIAEKAELPFKLSFHLARHSFADLARKKGWDVYAISKALGHSGLNVTEHYLAGFDGDLVDAKMSELFGNSDGKKDE